MEKKNFKYVYKEKFDKTDCEYCRKVFGSLIKTHGRSSLQWKNVENIENDKKVIEEAKDIFKEGEKRQVLNENNVRMEKTSFTFQILSYKIYENQVCEEQYKIM